MSKVSEKKAFFIVCIVALFLLGWSQAPEQTPTSSPSTSSSSSSSSSKKSSDQRPQHSQIDDDATSSTSKTSAPSIILDEIPSPRAPVEAFLSTKTKSLFSSSSSTCSSSRCGCGIAQKFDLDFVFVKEVSQSSHQSGSLDYFITIGQISGNTTELSWSARAFSDSFMVGSIPRKLSDHEIATLIKRKNDVDGSNTKKNLQSAWEFHFWLQPSKTDYSLEITLTWINDLFIGPKWWLPNRDDNPTQEVKKQKCLSLKLLGDCERFGMSVLNSTLSVGSETLERRSSNSDRRPRLPLCKTADQISSQGAWIKIPEKELEDTNLYPEELRGLLDDFVGLNRFQGGVWKWQPRTCDLNWFSRADALKTIIRGKGIKQITLFGDSMLLEQFHNFKKLLAPESTIRSKTQNKMRTLSFSTSSSSSTNENNNNNNNQQQQLTVTFLRSYTTSKGKSVIASPKVISNQVWATRPDVVVGNAAVLHWQQNMRSFEEWNSNIQSLAKKLCSSSSSIPKLFYFGPTLIQMGRTQGLQPQRTFAFGEAARNAFETECAGGDGTKGVNFNPFWMYNASISRRESAHDGQHWACYREWGGVAQTFTQMFLNLLLS